MDLAVAGAGVTLSGATPAKWTLGEPVRVDRDATFTLDATAAGAELLIVRVR